MSHFNLQFSFDRSDYLRSINLQNWYRYYALLKAAIAIAPKNILEIGAGNEITKSCLSPLVEKYNVMDINQRLDPDILSDLRTFRPELKESFDCIICADMLEHIPFEDLAIGIKNIFAYLVEGGWALITIPHRETRLLIITPFSHEKASLISLPGIHTPRGYWQKITSFLKKEEDIDPHHCWEIGRMKIGVSDIENNFKKNGFKIETFLKLLYVDMWILKK